MNLVDLTEKVKTGSLPPGELSNYQLILAGWYSYYAGQLEEIELNKSERWLKLRSQEGIKSDKQADRLWDSTEDGRNEIKLRWEMRRAERLISSIKTRLRVLEGEARAQF